MKTKRIPAFLLCLLVVLALACGSSAPTAAPATPDNQATVNAAIAATAQAQSNTQATIDAAVAATAMAAPPTPTPGPVNEYVELSEEELAAMIDQAVTEAVAATTQASASATQATSDDSVTTEEVTVVLDTVVTAEQAIAYADQLVGAYSELYGELATETMAMLGEVEQDLSAMAASMEAMNQTLNEINSTLSQGLALATETINQLENVAQQAASSLNQVQDQVKNWTKLAQTDRDHRANEIANIKPDKNAPTDLQSTLRTAFDFVDQIHSALGDNKLSRDELNRIAQLGANASAGFNSHGGQRFNGFSGKVNEITGQLARGQVPNAKRNTGNFQSSLGDRPSGGPGGPGRPGRP